MKELELNDEKPRWDQEESSGFGTDEGGEVGSRYLIYTPQLMDTQEMQALRAALNRSEKLILQQGHLKEYIPRKPASSKLRQWYGLPRHYRGINRSIMSAGPSSRPKSSDVITGLSDRNQSQERPATSRRPASSGVKAEEFATILKKETRQVRELERRYGDTKRSLLDYIEVVSSCKPNARVGGQEVYEQLADLISFATKCSGPE